MSLVTQGTGSVETQILFALFSAWCHAPWPCQFHQDTLWALLTAVSWLVGGTCHQQPPAMSQLQQQHLGLLRYNSGVIWLRSVSWLSLGGVPGHKQMAHFIWSPAPYLAGLPLAFYYHFMGLLRVFRAAQ